MDRHLNDSELRLGTYYDEITSYLDTIRKKKEVLKSFKDYTDVSSIKQSTENILKTVWECFFNSLHCKMPADFCFIMHQKPK